MWLLRDFRKITQVSGAKHIVISKQYPSSLVVPEMPMVVTAYRWGCSDFSLCWVKLAVTAVTGSSCASRGPLMSDVKPESRCVCAEAAGHCGVCFHFTSEETTFPPIKYSLWSLESDRLLLRRQVQPQLPESWLFHFKIFLSPTQSTGGDTFICFSWHYSSESFLIHGAESFVASRILIFEYCSQQRISSHALLCDK